MSNLTNVKLASRSSRPRRAGGLGALAGLARSLSHSFEMAREKALEERGEGRGWSGEERRTGPRREIEPAAARARVILSDLDQSDRRAVEDRRNDSNLARLDAGARRSEAASRARSRWA